MPEDISVEAEMSEPAFGSQNWVTAKLSTQPPRWESIVDRILRTMTMNLGSIPIRILHKKGSLDHNRHYNFFRNIR